MQEFDLRVEAGSQVCKGLVVVVIRFTMGVVEGGVGSVGQVGTMQGVVGGVVLSQTFEIGVGLLMVGRFGQAGRGTTCIFQGLEWGVGLTGVALLAPQSPPSPCFGLSPSTMSVLLRSPLESVLLEQVNVGLVALE